MSNITVKMFPARDGDCFLVSLGSKNRNHILIDCGYAETYNTFLKEELENIANNNEMIDLLVITHVDQDHIVGAIAFLKDNNKNNFIEIGEIWHNSYRHLHFHNRNREKINSQEKDNLEGIIALGSSQVNMLTQSNNQDISARQGSSLSALIKEGQYSWNKSFGSNAINLDYANIIQKKDYKIYLLSPNTEKLNKLAKEWLRELNKMKFGFNLTEEDIFDDAYEFFMLQQEEMQIEDSNISYNPIQSDKSIESVISQSKEEMDTSIINGSSISFIIEYDNKKLLFLADAHPDIIIENISKFKDIKFNLVKVSHHGSSKNTTNKLAKLLNSDLFLISTNGKGFHSHPDFNSLAKIIYHQKNHKKLFFNYNNKVAQRLENNKLKKKYDYSIYIPNDFVPTVINI